MYHSFDTDVAEIVGVNAAIIFNNIAFWVLKNEANNEHLHDGRYWTYNAKAGYKLLFPYLGETQIKNAFQRLIDEGLITTGCYNTLPFDRTLWYALTEKGKSLCMKPASPLAGNRQMEKDETTKPIPYITTDINNISPHTPTGGDHEPVEGSDGTEERFASFWDMYPRKMAKQAARKAWGKLKMSDALFTTIMKALAMQRKSPDWLRDNGQYVPHAATWLNGKRWEDEVKTAPGCKENAEAVPQRKKLTLITPKKE